MISNEISDIVFHSFTKYNVFLQRHMDCSPWRLRPASTTNLPQTQENSVPLAQRIYRSVQSLRLFNLKPHPIQCHLKERGVRVLAPVVSGIESVNLALHLGDVAFETGLCGRETRQSGEGMGLGRRFRAEKRISRDRMGGVLRCRVVCFNEFWFLREGDSSCGPNVRILESHPLHQSISVNHELGR